MNLPISPRLLACAALVPPHAHVADVGCDHGYLSIYLLKQGIASSVIASDINEGPLQSAMRNARKFGVAQNISFHLSAGVEKIPRDFDTLVCAGMGADTMISILDAAPWLKNKHYTLILQCQSKTPTLRQYLSQHGWQIEEESVLRDGRFLYTVIKTIWKETAPPLSVGQCHFPAVLLKNNCPETYEYYKQTVKKLRISVTGHGINADPEEVQALAYLESIQSSFPSERS